MVPLRSSLRLTALALWCVLLPGVAAASEPARRVVSMNPSLTATLVAIGARDALVGVDEFSARQQAAVSDLPTVGGLFNPNLEAVIALGPDLVTLVPSAEQRDFRGQLEELGVRVLALDPKSFDQVMDSILELGRAVGRLPDATERVREVRRVRSEAERVTRELPRSSVVFVVQREPLFVIGRGSFVDDMLASAGARNLAAEFGHPYPQVAAEWLVDAGPEVILDSSLDPTPAAEYWARYPSLPAVKAGRVLAMTPGAVTLPGPYLDRSLRILVRALHGVELE